MLEKQKGIAHRSSWERDPAHSDTLHLRQRRHVFCKGDFFSLQAHQLQLPVAPAHAQQVACKQWASSESAVWEERGKHTTRERATVGAPAQRGCTHRGRRMGEALDEGTIVDAEQSHLGVRGEGEHIAHRAPLWRQGDIHTGEGAEHHSHEA